MSNISTLVMKKFKVDVDIVPLVPNLFVVLAWRVASSVSVAFERRQGVVCGSRKEAMSLAVRWRDELTNGLTGAELRQEYEGLRVGIDCPANAHVFPAVGECMAVPWLPGFAEEGQDETKSLEDERKPADDHRAFLCFLWCHKKLQLALPKDVLKMLWNIVKEIKSIVYGWWPHGCFSSVYVLRIFTLVPTYDFYPVDRIRLIVAETDEHARRVTRQLFVEEVNNRWRPDFDSVVHEQATQDSREQICLGIRWRDDRTDGISFPEHWNVDTCDQFSTIALKALWNCCDDNLAPKCREGPAEAVLTKYVQGADGVWKEEKGSAWRMPQK